MTAPVDISAELAEWTRLAGYEVTQASQQEVPPGSQHDDRTIIWANMGEIRYFIAAHSDGWFIVTDSHRMSDEQFVFAARSMEVVELYFYGKCGLSARFARDLPPLKYPRTVEDVANGYRIDTTSFDGTENLALFGPANSVIAVTGSGKIAGTAELAAMSIYLTSTIDAIKASYLDAGGRPLFNLRDT